LRGFKALSKGEIHCTLFLLFLPPLLTTNLLRNQSAPPHTHTLAQTTQPPLPLPPNSTRPQDRSPNLRRNSTPSSSAPPQAFPRREPTRIRTRHALSFADEGIYLVGPIHYDVERDLSRPGRNAEGERIRRSSASLQTEGGSCGRCERSPDLGFAGGGGGHGEHDLQRGGEGRKTEGGNASPN